MEIELFKVPDSPMYIPFVKGEVYREFFEFLVYRFHWPKKINSMMRPIDESSLRNVAYDLKQFLEVLAANKLKLSTLQFTDFEKLLNEQQKAYGWTNDTYNTKYVRCREFFDFLSFRNVPHRMVFPERRISALGLNSDNGAEQTVFYSADDGLKRTQDNYDCQYKVISIERYGELYRRLSDIDRVYGVIAQTMMQTCLRVSNVCQIPFSNNSQNREWLLWPEFKALGLDYLKFHHVAKGKKPAWCYVWPSTIETIYSEYIHPCYESRKRLFLEKYSKRKNASLVQGYVNLPRDILWLNNNGAPVKPYMVEQAFRDTGLGIVPHDLRHTGATHLLWNYCRLKGIDPDERMAVQFQSFLQFQLGHVSIKTTRYYIRTIINKRAQVVIPFALPMNRNELDAKLPVEALEQMKLLEFFSGVSKSIVHSEDGIC